MSRFTLKDLTRRVLEEEKRPLTVEKIWEIAKQRGYDKLGDFRGKTPWRSIGALIYVDIRDNPESPFAKIDSKPRKFFLRSLVSESEIREITKKEKGEIEEPKKAPAKSKPKGNPLKELTAQELRELCKKFNLKGFSKFKQKELASYVAKNLSLPPGEIEAIITDFKKDRLCSKIKDAKDFFMAGKIAIEAFESDLIIGNVGGYKVVIRNLGRDSFEYSCDERCYDWQYQVRSGRYPFCKHYVATIMQAIYSGQINPDEKVPNFLSEFLQIINEIIEDKKREDGILPSVGRTIEEDLQCLKSDFFKISLQDTTLARKKYGERPEKVFEHLTNKAFQLLEFDTIERRRIEGWDLLAIASLASPPYIVVIECKTAASGIYDYLVKDPNYLIRLKTYCVDMVKNKLFGIYKDYLKAMVVIAPGFPKEIEALAPQFAHMAEGIRLSFLPVPSLLELVEKYRASPILTHSIMERLFTMEKIIDTSDVDNLFLFAKNQINELIRRSKNKLRSKIESLALKTADACFIKMDNILLQSITNDILSVFVPDLVNIGKSGTSGIEIYSLKHDYYQIWSQVLHGLVDEFTDILKKTSFMEVKRTDLKEALLRFLEL